MLCCQSNFSFISIWSFQGRLFSLPSRAEMKFSSCQEKFTETCSCNIQTRAEFRVVRLAIHRTRRGRINAARESSRPRSNSALNVDPAATRVVFLWHLSFCQYFCMGILRPSFVSGVKSGGWHMNERKWKGGEKRTTASDRERNNENRGLTKVKCKCKNLNQKVF